MQDCLVRGHGNGRGEGWLHKTLAPEIGLASPDMINRYLNNGKLPNYTTFRKMCDVFLGEANSNGSLAEEDVSRLRTAFEQEVLEKLRDRQSEPSKLPYIFSELKEARFLDENREEDFYVLSRVISGYAIGASAGTFAIAAFMFALNLL